MSDTIRIGNAGLRGKIGSGLTPETAMDYALALGTYLEGGTVVVARDTRISSLMLRHAAVSALTSCGCNVVDAGVVSAPQLHHLIPKTGAAGGLLIGAGHHPGGWNALVPLGAGGAYFNILQHGALLSIYESKRFNAVAWDRIGTVREPGEEDLDAYLDYLLGLLDVEAIAARRLKVVLDFCNGSGVAMGLRFAERLGLEVVPINQAASGVLPHSPEPRPRTAVQVKSIVDAVGADVGFVFNSDFSRVSIVTDTGETLSEEYTFPLVADQVLARALGSTVVTNVCTTRTLDDVVKRHGGCLQKTAVGQAAVIDAMTASGALLAGDGSGSVARSGLAGFDAFMAMGLILEAAARTDKSVSELADRLPRYHIVKKKIPCRTAQAYGALRSACAAFEDASMTENDGMRLDWLEGWLHLRLSSTEPVIRLISEWPTPEMADEMASRARGFIEKEVAS